MAVKLHDAMDTDMITWEVIDDDTMGEEQEPLSLAEAAPKKAAAKKAPAKKAVAKTQAAADDSDESAEEPVSKHNAAEQAWG